MSDQSDTDVVVVDVADDAPADDAPDVVVVDTGDDASGDELDIGLMLGRIEATQAIILERLNTVEQQQEFTDNTADAALSVAGEAAAVAVEAAVVAEDAAAEAEDIAEEVEQEVIEPEREHKLWANKRTLFGRKDDAQ